MLFYPGRALFDPDRVFFDPGKVLFDPGTVAPVLKIRSWNPGKVREMADLKPGHCRVANEL